MWPILYFPFSILNYFSGGVDGCDTAEILRLIECGQLDTTPLITHIFPLNEIEAAYDLFEKRRDGVMKVALTVQQSRRSHSVGRTPTRDGSCRPSLPLRRPHPRRRAGC